MAAGDTTISIAVEGGVTKTVVLDSAIREKAKLQTDNTEDGDWSDAAWAAFECNKLASVILSQANSQLASEVTFTAAIFTSAT